MLTTNLDLAEKYDYLGEKFKKAFAFLKNTDLAALPVGNVPIDGDDIYANVQSYVTMAPEECAFESHRAYFDIQYVVCGEEIMEMAFAAGLTIDTPYDEEADVAFYYDPETCSLAYLRGGQFAIVSPEEAHKPRCAPHQPGNVRKVVLKIRI